MYWHVYTSTSTSSHTHVYLQKWTRCRFTTARMGTLITSGERTFVGQSTVKIPSCSQVMEMMKTKECFLSCCLHNGLLLIVPVCLCSPSPHQHVQACDVPFVRPVVAWSLLSHQLSSRHHPLIWTSVERCLRCSTYISVWTIRYKHARNRTIHHGVSRANLHNSHHINADQDTWICIRSSCAAKAQVQRFDTLFVRKITRVYYTLTHFYADTGASWNTALATSLNENINTETDYTM